MGSPSNRHPRVITDIKVGLATNTGNGNAWHMLQRVPCAAADKVMNVGDTLQLSTQVVRLPLEGSFSPVGHWFVVEMTNVLLDRANPDQTKSGVCYAHSSRNVFAPALATGVQR